ncbi:serine/threonine-protein kinase 31-like isoform X1 [Carassius carassius]|uniref:serine/threonine-protein kinase 31-like isoform X1 n=1 Tax=Carassius carassius TaxID=217509 RepID=UPI002868A93D|nr:serine/threonine-protein kinase 31-like isoform X1 [Carassius carassius]XP_059363472.1 serine/threonine-protein kinase 31-like isoform X1 [Carassius carassius]XP_059363473.1 serine/threonine-protein kinase 31-like isoform X1 [Carassius carassius]XP_059363474.1 serine/threonine-protein kinase 31-like isoform X1 [Carassius carassius]
MEQSVIQPEKMELVVVTHVVDAITFWAQNVTDKINEKINVMLTEKCPSAPILMGRPSSHKVYGARYSEDKCWYRCTVQQQSEDKFCILYIDYGNTEIVSRSDLVELPEELQTTGLAKKYKFWGFHVSSEQDSPLFSQGKSFLHNMIHGKKLRVHKKSVCFDGIILVEAFQGNLDIGEELLKFKFAKVSLPGNRENSLPTVNLQECPGLWPSRNTPGELDTLGSSLGCMPKLRPIFSDQKPQIIKEQKTSVALQPLEKLNVDQEPLTEIQSSKTDANAQQVCSQDIEQVPNETESELQMMREVINAKDMQIKKLKEEESAIQQHASLLGQQLEEAKLELQMLKESYEKTKETEHNHPTTIANRISQLAKKVDSLRKLRESSACSSDEDHLLESITIIMNYRISLPLSSERLDLAWNVYDQTLENLRGCQTMVEVESLVNIRNEARGALLAAVDDFLQEVDKLPINERLHRLKEVASSLTAMLSSVMLGEKTEECSFEKFCEWKEHKQQKIKNVRKATDEALLALSSWATRLSKFSYLMEKTSLTEEDVADCVEEILMNADKALCEELSTESSEQDDQGRKMVFSAFNKAMQGIQREQSMLNAVRQKYELNTQFKQEIQQWQSGPPKADELFAVKKRIRSLRSQLRWKLVEVSCLEEAEELDLPEILKKKEEIAETRNALFQEISHEKKQYIMLCDLMKRGFPELPMIYPDADINGYRRSAGLLMKSLDRDMFDADPMRELSGRRPLLSTDFQGQKIVLKCYAVDEESEVKMLEQAAHYHRAQQQSPATTVPLLALFCGKSDPLAYVMVPHYSNGSLRAIQRSSPLSSSEIRKVMKGVALGLQGLHAASLTHASLHPNNVFAIGREKGIVGDYDFTKTPEQRVFDSGMVAGSISLVAPELKQRQPPSPASDMYAFGGIMLWLHVPDFSGSLESEHQNVEFCGLGLDAKLHKLLSKLLISSTRLSAPEALKEDYFISVDV